MEQILVGLILFNAFLTPNDYQYDTFEVAQTSFSKNNSSDLSFSNNEFSEIDAISLGSREYDQITPWFRVGQATYIYSQNSKTTDGTRKLKQFGGYAGFLAELNYKRYFGVGVLVGGGAAKTEYNLSNLSSKDSTSYFTVISPYVSLGLPITNTASINLKATSYNLSDPKANFDGSGLGFEAPHNLDSNIGVEFVWSWK